MKKKTPKETENNLYNFMKVSYTLTTKPLSPKRKIKSGWQWLLKGYDIKYDIP